MRMIGLKCHDQLAQECTTLDANIAVLRMAEPDAPFKVARLRQIFRGEWQQSIAGKWHFSEDTLLCTLCMDVQAHHGAGRKTLPRKDNLPGHQNLDSGIGFGQHFETCAKRFNAQSRCSSWR